MCARICVRLCVLFALCARLQQGRACARVYSGEHRREGGGLDGKGRRQLGDSIVGNVRVRVRV